MVFSRLFVCAIGRALPLTGFQAFSCAIVILFDAAMLSQVSVGFTVYTLQVFWMHNLPLVGNPLQ